MSTSLNDPFSTESCKSNKDIVNGLEICTLAVAKKYQIDDPNYYFKEGYNNLKSHNEKWDDLSKTDRYESLCRLNSKTNKGHSLCALEHGFGFAENPRDPAQCIAFQCPPGFTPNKTNTGCIKPKTIDGTKPKTEFCDERWYDWFMIPNYHLGNKFVKMDNDKCYQPCNPGYVPSFGTDPVDGYSPGVGITDLPNMCATKESYMGGKYNTYQNYCPIAVIKRLSSTIDSLTKDYNNMLVNKYTEANEQIADAVKKDKIDPNIEKNVKDMVASINSTLEDVYPLSQNDITACRTLIDDQRVAEAYNICDTLNENSDYYVSKMTDDGVSLPTAELKVKLLKKACHSLFCNPNDNPLSSISNTVYTGPDGTEIIIDVDKTFCFPDVANDRDIQPLVTNHNKSGASKINKTKSNTPTKSYIDIYKDAKPPSYTDQNDKMILSIKIIPNIIAAVILIYVVYIFFTETTIGKNIWKWIKKIAFKVWAFLTCISIKESTTTKE